MMPVVVNIEKVGTYRKLADKTTIPGSLPNLLNEDSRMYGRLRNKIDLKRGWEGFKDEGYGDIFHSLFDYIQKTSRQGTPLKEVIGADFMSNRRILITFAKSAHERQREDIRAVRRNGIIFLCNRKSENDTLSDDGHGYKFEQYMTLNDNGEPHDESEPVSNAECSKAVLRTSFKLGSDEIKVYYAAEIDAIDSQRNFAEMKTTSSDYKRWLEKQSLHHYLQSYFGDVPYIVKGQKTRDLILYRVDKVWTTSIPEKEVNWKAEVCMKRLFEVLQQIKEQLKNDDEANVVRVREYSIFYEPEDADNCTFVDSNILRYFE